MPTPQHASIALPPYIADGLRRAEQALTASNTRYRKKALAALPGVLTDQLLRRADGMVDHREGNRYCAAIGHTLRVARFALDMGALESRAAWCASLAGGSSEKGMKEVLEAHGIPEPSGPQVTTASKRRRYRAPRWWRRVLRSHYARSWENAARSAGLVGRSVSPYVSQAGLALYRAHGAAMREYLDGMEAINTESGEVIDLADIAAASLANPKIRRHELMAKVSGLERFSQSMGHSWCFLVTTCPSRFHAYGEDGLANRKHRGESVTDGQLYHRACWARVRARAAKAKLVYYGLRTVEPHHDGTAHWNLLIFGPSEDLTRMADLVREVWLAESPHEAGAQERRVKARWGDQQKGSAAGYVAKYISKATDAHSLESDLESDAPPLEAAERATAWARLHRIRQFQFFKSPRAAVWRELRRLTEDTGIDVIDRLLVTCTKPVDYAAYLTAQHWKAGSVDGVLVGTYSGIRMQQDREGLWRPAQTCWGEEAAASVEGLQDTWDGRRACTRRHDWQVRSKERERFLRGSSSDPPARSAPWTCINNCNLPSIADIEEAVREYQAQKAHPPPEKRFGPTITVEDIAKEQQDFDW